MKRGEIHALVGEHGAGKSSICHVLCGLRKPSGGRIFIKGEDVLRRYNSKEASLKGITLVSQHTSLCEHLSIAKNIYMNQISFHNRLFFHYDKVKKEISNFLEENGIDFNINSKVFSLIQSDRVFVDILRHLYTSPSLIMLDEALEKLTAESLQKVLAIINRKKKEGMSVLFVTHRIDDIYRFADRVSVIRDGKILATESVEDIDKFNLIKLAYTKFQDSNSLFLTDRDFYNLLKYNEAILESLPVNLLVTDNEGNIKLINRRGFSFFSNAEKLIEDKSIRFPVSNLFEKGSSVLEKLLSAISSKNECTVYNEVYQSAEGSRIVNINTLPIKDGNWRIGTIIMVDDVTEQVKMREKIFFSEKLASIGILSAGVAHEINNPLEILQNNIDFLRESFTSRKDENSELPEVLDEMGEEIEAISNIVGSLASVSGERNRTREILNLPSVLKSVLKLVKPYAKGRDTKLKSGVLCDSCFIEADKTELRQVILNILKNSFEALSEGGEISVTVRTESNNALLVFEDNGKGLESDNPEDIFLPFYSTKKSDGSSMGLGLYMTYRLVSDNGGTIEAENREEGGCRFTLRFPLVKASI